MPSLKSYVVRMSDGHEVRINAFQQLGTPATPYFVDEKQDTVAGFGVVLGWWSEGVEIKAARQEQKPNTENDNATDGDKS